MSGPENVAVQVINTTSVRISWDPPPLEDRRGIIRNYTVRVTYPNNTIMTTVEQTWAVITGEVHIVLVTFLVYIRTLKQ